MIRDQSIETIRAACIKANPEIETRKIEGFNEDDVELGSFWLQDNTIRLSDVLCALREVRNHKGIAVDQDGLFIQPSLQKDRGWEHCGGLWGTPPVWDIYKDDLTSQSDECLVFLEDLLK